MLRTCFSFAVVPRVKESLAKAMESSTARGISCTFDPLLLPSDSLDILLLLFRLNYRKCLAETIRNSQQAFVVDLASAFRFSGR